MSYHSPSKGGTMKILSFGLILICLASVTAVGGIEGIDSQNELRLCSTERPPPPPTIRRDERTELAWAKLYTWGKGSNLTICFVGGDPKVRQGVHDAAQGWLKYANINFVFVGDCGDSSNPIRNQSQLRIGFDPTTGSWSQIGTLAKKVPLNAMTMNFGWLDSNTDVTEYHRVVLHEFGHALGCIHEHQSPAVVIDWDKPKVLSYYWRTNRWNAAKVKVNIFDRADSADTGNTPFDKYSIMEYYFAPELTKNHVELPNNSELSELDKDMIGRLYPF
jgi:serralysin